MFNGRLAGQQFWAVARHTTTEAVRQPLYTVVLLLGIFLLALAPGLSAYTLEDDNKLLVDMGLSTIFLSGLFLAAFTASGGVEREIVQRTVLTVVSKPIGRAVFLSGKLLGVIGALAVAHWIWSLVFLLAVRHEVMQRVSDTFDGPVFAFGVGLGLAALLAAALINYRWRLPFGSTMARTLAGTMPVATLLTFCFDKQWALQNPLSEWDGQHAWALVLLLQAESILAAVAVAAATRLGQVLTLCACLGVFLAGLSSDYLLGRHATEHLAARLLHGAIPNLQFHWVADALTHGNVVTATYVLTVSVYTALQLGAILALGCLLFQRRDVG